VSLSGAKTRRKRLAHSAPQELKTIEERFEVAPAAVSLKPCVDVFHDIHRRSYIFRRMVTKEETLRHLDASWGPSGVWFNPDELEGASSLPTQLGKSVEATVEVLKYIGFISPGKGKTVKEDVLRLCLGAGRGFARRKFGQKYWFVLLEKGEETPIICPTTVKKLKGADGTPARSATPPRPPPALDSSTSVNQESGRKRDKMTRQRSFERQRDSFSLGNQNALMAGQTGGYETDDAEIDGVSWVHPKYHIKKLENDLADLKASHLTVITNLKSVLRDVTARYDTCATKVTALEACLDTQQGDLLAHRHFSLSQVKEFVALQDAF
jgi:hypothetical protein